MFKKFIKKLSQLVLASLVMIAPALSSVAPSKVYAKASSDTTEPIAEIFDSTTGQFKTTELTQLIQKVTNSSNTGDDLFDDLVEVAESTKTSAQIRSNNDSEDVYVTFGGLEWTVTYLSLDDNNRPILTLWLANRLNTQFTDWNGETMKGYDNESWAITETAQPGVSAYASGWWSSDRTATNPGNMYSTSYIRSLMIGSQYVQGYTDSTKTTKADNTIDVEYFDLVDGTQASVFANFINDYGSYLVSPSKVSWQRSGLHASDWEDWAYDLPNDTYEASTNASASEYTITATGVSGEPYYYYTGTSGNYTQNGNNMNYSQREHYADWKNDKLWLPSLTEVGYADSGDSGVGLWATSEEQRRLVTSAEDEDWPKDYSWLRSGNYDSADGAYDVFPAGASYDNYKPYIAFALRPALHLNLKSAAISGGIKTTVFPNTGVSGAFSAVVITIAGIFVIGLLSVMLVKPKKIIIKK